MKLCKEIKEHQVRALKTLILCLLFVGLGIYGATPGVTLLDLGILTNTTTGEIAKILPARSGGYALGALISGFIVDYVDHQICLMFSLAISITTFAALPYFQSIRVMYAIIFWAGVSAGCIDTIGNVYTIFLWRKKVAPFIQAVHFAFGLGAFISPLIANPFLLDATEEIEEFGRDISKNYPSFENISYSSIANIPHDHNSHRPVYRVEDLRIHWAYIIISIFNLSVLFFFIIVYIFRPVTKEYPSDTNSPSPVNQSTPKKVPIDNNSNIENEKSFELEKSENFYKPSIVENSEPIDEFALVEPLEPHMKLIVVGLSVFFFHLYCGLEISFGGLLTPFAVKSNLHMSKSDGAFLASVYWGTFSFFRIFSLFTITIFSPRALLIFNMVLIMLSNAFLLPLSNDHEWALWVGSALIGLGCSSVFATMFAFVEQLTPVTPRITSIIMISCCLGEFIIPLIVGIWIDTNPEVFLYVIFGYSTMSLIVLIMLFAIQHRLLKAQQTKCLN